MVDRHSGTPCGYIFLPGPRFHPWTVLGWRVLGVGWLSCLLFCALEDSWMVLSMFATLGLSWVGGCWLQVPPTLGLSWVGRGLWFFL